jgi:hypothetical protein
MLSTPKRATCGKCGALCIPSDTALYNILPPPGTGGTSRVATLCTVTRDAQPGCGPVLERQYPGLVYETPF